MVWKLQLVPLLELSLQHAGSLSQLTETLEYNGDIINVICNTCAFPTVNSQNVCGEKVTHPHSTEERTKRSDITYPDPLSKLICVWELIIRPREVTEKSRDRARVSIRVGCVPLTANAPSSKEN